MSSSSSYRIPPSTNTKFERRMLAEEIQKLFDDSIQECFPQLPDEIAMLSPLRRVGQELQEKYGDYICINIFTICEGLRKKKSKLIRETTSRAIARIVLKDVIKRNEESKMIQEFSLRFAGYITFKLSMEWMTKRIHKMLEDGIDTWAPVNLEKAVLTITKAAYNVDLRSSYIRCMLQNILDFAGVAVDTGVDSIYCANVVHGAGGYFIEDQGVMTSRRNGTRLFKGKTSSFGDVFEDLRVLWNAINCQGAQLIVFITPVQQREYVEKLFAAAKNEEWLPPGEYPVLLCCGYRASSERNMLASLWEEYICHSNAPSLRKLGKDAGYTAETFFECAVVYTYLKNHRLAECRFNIDEMLGEEGDTFVYLLKTLAIFPSLIENFGSRGMVKYTKACFRKERELAVHLVQFTEVIDEACLTFKLHLVCEYLLNLCMKFTSYYYEVLVHLDFKVYKSKLQLCNATSVVMKKCFDLLGISPESPRLSRMHIEKKTDFEVFPWRVCDPPRPKNVNPRIEMFCMNVHVSHPSFKMCDVFGIVSLIDTDGALSDKRLPLDENENGCVSYFFRDWYEPVGISNNGFVFFGNPSPPYSPPFASVLEIYLRLYATTVGNDKCVLLCKEVYPIDFSRFWAEGQDYKRATFVFEGVNASIDIDYIALRDAIDTSMELSFNSPCDPLLEASVKGHIFAYYGGVLDGLEGLKQRCYKAVLFQANDDLTVKVGPISLERSVLAVPANGTLVIEALFLDVGTGEVILNKKTTLDPKPNSISKCVMPWKNCFFNLTVEWSQGQVTTPFDYCTQ